MLLVKLIFSKFLASFLSRVKPGVSQEGAQSRGRAGGGGASEGGGGRWGMPKGSIFLSHGLVAKGYRKHDIFTQPLKQYTDHPSSQGVQNNIVIKSRVS